MPRPKTPVILRQGNAIKKFDSIASAASFLGVYPATINQVLKHKQRRNTVRGFQVEYDNEAPPAPKKKKEMFLDMFEKGIIHLWRIRAYRQGKMFDYADGKWKTCTSSAGWIECQEPYNDLTK